MKTGRNDPCPCGSGKKYKKCCLSKTYIEKGRENSAQEKLVQDLMRFFKKNYKDRLDDAYLFFWDDFIPEENLDADLLDFSDINFWEWVVYDYLIDEDNDKTLIDLYMENNKRLSPDEHTMLTKMKNSVISLYEVEEVFPEKGLLLKDLLLGGEYDVSEKAATRSLRKWDIFATRLLNVDGAYIMSGSVYPYDLKRKEMILEEIHAELEDFWIDCPDAAFDDFLKKNSEIFNYLWYDIIQYPPPLKLATTSGEPLLFSKAVFEIKDKQAVTDGLQKIKGFKRKKEGFEWLDNKSKEGSTTILGNAEIKDGKLILSTNSKKRLEKGKKLILDALSDALIYKIDTFQDPMEALKDYEKKTHEEPKNKIPLDIQQQVYSQFMKNHCEKWMKQKLPALDGKTPEQAVKTKEGRRRVVEILKSFENNEEHNKREGNPFYDLSWMWERLGIEREI